MTDSSEHLDRPTLVGISDEDARASAEAFFSVWRWEPTRLDPSTMTAEQFLDAL